MKPIRAAIIILLSVIICASAQAQIKTAYSKVIVDTPQSIPPFDSTKNFHGPEKVYSYVNQLLYIKGLTKEYRETGYSGFYQKKGPQKNNSVYGHKTKVFNSTEYDDLAGKYFTVLTIEPDNTDSNKYWFHLQNRDNPNDIAWFEYTGHEIDFPFIVVSHWNYLQQFIGKTINKEDQLIFFVSQKDFKTAEYIPETFNKEWTIIDIILDENDYEIKALVENKDNTSTINIDDVLLLWPSNQSTKTNEPNDEYDLRQSLVYEKPFFQEGDFQKWVQNQLTSAGNESKWIMVEFTIGIDGKVSNVRTMQNSDPYLDAEVIRVISNSPAWKPGKNIYGEAIPVTYTFPIVLPEQ